METRNVTLSIPREILHKAKMLAVQRETSLCRLLTEVLEDLVAREDRYAAAARSHQERLDRGLDLGTGGLLAWRREDLHER